MKIAIVHDYLIQMGGAERVVGVLHSLFPHAPVYTTIMDASRLIDPLKIADIRTTWMQCLPGIENNFQRMLPLYPLAVRSLRFDDYDIVISSSSAFAKGIKVSKGTFHICYCHTPMRFAWNFDGYVERLGLPAVWKAGLRLYMGYLRRWDRNTTGVNRFVANSSAVQRRISNCYRRKADIIFPPVDTSRFSISGKEGSYYLIVSRLVSYKRIDLAIEAFNVLGLPLYIVGEGPDLARLKGMAKTNVSFLGRLADEEVSRLLSECRALLLPGEEDFGITPLEANAAGRPVLAYAAGGALDTIESGVNGLLFHEQRPELIVECVRRFEACSWDSHLILKHACRFDVEVFKKKFADYLYSSYEQFLNLRKNHSR